MKNEGFQSDVLSREKVASATILSMAEGMKEMALTEVGESDHPAVEYACMKLLEQSMLFEMLAFKLRHGIVTIAEANNDIPF